MLRFKILFLLPLVACVAGQNNGIGYYGSSNVRDQRRYQPQGYRPRPPPLSHRPIANPLYPTPMPSYVPPASTPAYVPLTYPPGFSRPHIPLRPLREPPTEGTRLPPPVETVPPPTAAPAPAPPATAEPAPPVTAAPQPPAVPMPLPESPKPEIEPKPEFISPPEVVEDPFPVPQPAPAPKPEPTPSEVKPLLELTPKPVPPPPGISSGALPPLLPKPKPIREPAFGRPTQPAIDPNYLDTTETIIYDSSSYAPPVSESTHAPPTIAPSQAPELPDGSYEENFVCKKANAYYAVEKECDAYIQCQQGVAMKYYCPDGLHFKPSARRFEYPCAYPSEVKCKAGTETQTPRPTDQCPRQYGYFPVNDGDCSKYIMCQEGAATVMDCPAGLVFNPVYSICDWVANVPQCNPYVFKDYTCPDPPVLADGSISDIIYKYKYGQQCKQYIACQRGHPRLLSCDRGLAFDEVSQSCIDEDKIQGCSITPY